MKKTVSLILVISVFISLIFTSGALAVFKGDVNDDDEVNNKDVVTMFRYVSGSEKAEDDSAYDFNDDGEVDNKDVVSLFRFVSSGAEPEELEPEIPEPTPDEYFEFTLLDDGTYEITAKDKNSLPNDIVIPEQHNSKLVSTIAVDAFSESNIEQIIIGEGVIVIKDCAFWKCSDLKSVTLPASLHTIGEEVFKDCDNLAYASFSAPDGWDKFSTGNLFNKSSAAEKLKTEFDVWTHHIWGVTEIWTALTCTQDGYGKHTCSVCGLCEEYHIRATGHDFDINDVCKKCGEPYTPIDDSYFEFSRLDDGTYEIKIKNDVNLPSYVILPKEHNGRPVTSIGDYAFHGCWNLKNITICDSVTSIGVWAFEGCINLKNIMIPNSVISIGKEAFYYSGLESVTIPDSVTSIGESAFYDCPSLVFNEYDNALYLGNANNPYHALIDVKNTSIRYININEKTKVIANYALCVCRSLKSVTIPNDVTSIGDYAFYDCVSLKNIYILGNVITIGDYAFYCYNLTNISIPGSVKSIGEGAFYSCNNLKKVYYSSNKYSWDNILIGNNNDPLQYADFLYNAVVIDDNIYIIFDTYCSCAGGCNPELDVIKIHSEIKFNGGTIPVKSIEANAFYGCSYLKSVTIPDSVTSIGESAFSDCHSLVFNEYDNALYLGNANNPYFALIESKDSRAKYTSITSININEKTKVIANGAFYECLYLENITIPGSITSIGDYAFFCCGSLKNIKIPDSVTSIGKGAFAGCNHITSVTIPDGVTSICESTFYGCEGLTRVTIPHGITSIGDNAFLCCSNLTDITYKGTKSQWNNISKGNSWNLAVGDYTIHCTDEDIAK